MVEARLKMKNGAPAVYVNGEEFPFSQAITVRTHKNGKIIFDEEYFKGLTQKTSAKCYISEHNIPADRVKFIGMFLV